VADDEILALERALERGDEGARLRLGRALERVGRRDDALEALRDGIDDPAVRQELARFPAWSHRDASSGRSRFVDVAPVTRAPRVRWRAGVGEDASVRVSPLAVATNRGDVIDPRTGARRRSEDAQPLALEGEVLLVGNQGGDEHSLVAEDVFTGERFHETPLPIDETLKGPRLFSDHYGFGLVVTTERFALEVDDPRRPPRAVWHRPAPVPWFSEWGESRRMTRRILAILKGTLLLPDVVVFDCTGDPLVLERATGREIRRLPRGSWVGDEHGLVGSTEPGLVIYERGSQRSFETDFFDISALTPEWILAATVEGKIVATPRAGGGPTFPIGLAEDKVAVARETVVLANEQGLAAVTIRGEPLWRLSNAELELEADDQVEELALDARRVYATTKDGRLLCLEG
jgi:hypothetical protein